MAAKAHNVLCILLGDLIICAGPRLGSIGALIITYTIFFFFFGGGVLLITMVYDTPKPDSNY